MRQWRENATDEQRQIWSKQASARRVRRRAAQKKEEEAEQRKEENKKEKKRKTRHAEAQARYRAKQKLKKTPLTPNTKAKKIAEAIESSTPDTCDMRIE